MTPSVLVVTVTFNTGESLRPFLESVQDASDDQQMVVVVDNASTQLRDERATAQAHGAIFLELPQNLGYGAGVTAGVAHYGANADYILITNPDVTFSPGAIDTLVAAAEHHTDAGALGPQILTAEGTVYPSARSLPSLRTGIGHALFSRIWLANPWSRSYRFDQGYGALVRDAGWLSGACLLVRKSAFDSIGGFNPRFFMYFEDVDLGARLGAAGWRNLYVPEAHVIHTGAHSTTGSAKQMEQAHHDSAYIYLAQKYSAWYFAPLRGVLRVGLSVRSWWVTR